MIVFGSTLGRYAVVLHLASRGAPAVVSGASFRGAAVADAEDHDVGAVGGDHHLDSHHRSRSLQEDPCLGKNKKKDCPTGVFGTCDWIKGGCVPAVAPPPPPPSTTSPTREPTSSSPTNPPSPAPQTSQTYCGCPRCTSAVWDALACVGSDCHTCGNRIWYKRSPEGGGLSELEACAFIAEEFPDGPCGPECHPDLCISGSPTSSPTKGPTKGPTDATPSPTTPPTPSTTEQFFCGCPSCTASVWDHVACNGSECYPCGDRINYLRSAFGRTEEEACTQVSNEFPNNECGPACNPEICNPEYLVEPDELNLVWSDEFDVDGAPDPSKWDYDIGDGCSAGICGWGNSEEQEYTSDQNNAVVDGGLLRISAKRTPSGYASARMVSRGKKAFKYGRVRFRASLANCQALGTWPALWMLPENWEYGGWPDSGEIDVMETVGREPDRFFGTVHTKAYNHGMGTERGGSLPRSKDDWHVFEVDWQEDRIKFALDSQVYYVFVPDDVSDYEKWPFDKEFHLLMNIAVGGTWGGSVDAAAFEGEGQYMDIDWVRVYSS